MFPLKINKLFSIFLNIFFFTFFIFTNSNQIILPFKTESINIESSKYIEGITDNKIYISIDVGDPPQKINLYLTMDTTSLIISNSSISSLYYNNLKSDTYVNTSKLTQFYLEYFSKGYYSKENFIFPISYDLSNTKKFSNIEFIHVIEYSDTSHISSGYFGLQIPKANKMNIFENLKNADVISSYVFEINYSSDNEGYLSIGEFPQKFTDKTDENIRRANALPCSNDDKNLCWNLKFNDISFGDIKVNRDRDATLTPELGVIVGTKEYMQKIEENYFGKSLKDKCEQKLSENFYYYYECEKNADISTFKDLIFEHQEFMHNFILDKNDLFKTYGDKLYFLIVFDKFSSFGKSWKLGKPFIKKYNFLYGIDNKKIYFYGNKANDDKSTNNLIYWVIIGILGLGVIVMIFLVLTKVIFKPKKIKANELIEDYDYSSPENNNNENEKDSNLLIN